MSQLDGLARRLWMVCEPIHAITYFAPEARQAYEDVGLRGFWRGYFAGRAAPLGEAGVGAVVATFYNFDPGFVARAVPEVWTRITPAHAIEARWIGAGQALRSLLGSVDAPVAEAADLLQRAMEPASPSGRPLFAANAELPWPDEQYAALWHATTLAREFRGDGHLAALVLAELDGCEAHVLRLASAGGDRDQIQAARGWSDESWSAAISRLAGRGLVGAGDGAATADGRALVDQVEAATDRVASAPIAELGEADALRLIGMLEPIARLVTETGMMPFPNPIGLPPAMT